MAVNEQSALLSNFKSKSNDGHDHSHSHGHSHDHGHSYHDDDVKISHDHNDTQEDPVLKRLKTAVALCLTFMLVEVVGGYLAGSLAVMSDAAHLMADLASFAVAIVAAYLSARPSTPQHTYGLKRTESLAALFSMVTLAILSVGLALEASRRIYYLTRENTSSDLHEHDVDGRLMSGIATIGVVVNLALAAVLGENHTHLPGGGGHDHDHSHGHGHHDDNDHDEEHGHHFSRRSSSQIHSNEVLPEDEVHVQNENPKRNVNLEAAYLHVMADLAQSVAVLIAGLIIWWKPDWKIVDPIATILFSCLVFWSTIGVIRSAICVLLEEVPPHVSWQIIHDAVESIPNVTDLHDLHVWSISHGINAMSVHVRAIHAKDSSDSDKNVNTVLAEIAKIARANGISHSTIQVQATPSDANDNNMACIACAMADESQSCVRNGGYIMETC